MSPGRPARTGIVLFCKNDGVGRTKAALPDASRHIERPFQQLAQTAQPRAGCEPDTTHTLGRTQWPLMDETRLDPRISAHDEIARPALPAPTSGIVLIRRQFHLTVGQSRLPIHYPWALVSAAHMLQEEWLQGRASPPQVTPTLVAEYFLSLDSSEPP